MSQEAEKDQIIEIIARFKADLIWDDIVGIFDLVPPETKGQLEAQYIAAIKGAAQKLGQPIDELQARIEELAYTRVNGLTYRQEDVTARLKQYGIEHNEADSAQ
jgi:hypothetical protein